GSDDDHVAPTKHIFKRTFTDDRKFAGRSGTNGRRQNIFRSVFIVSNLSQLRSAADLPGPMILFTWIVKVGGIVHEIVDQEIRLANPRTKPTAAITHLGVLDSGYSGPQHYQVFNFLVVIAGIEHID